MKKPVALIIMDGFGINNSEAGNAIKAAKTPNLDRLFSAYPHTQIAASGMDVGLPAGQMGNSEVGHTNIGAGRVVYQELTRITKSIDDGDFYSNKALMAAVENSRKHDSALHLMGLLSSGGVHSHISHLFGLIGLAKKEGLKKVYIHCIMDGRDVSPTSGVDFLGELSEQLKVYELGKIATVVGRYYAMDRDTNWDRVKKAYDAMVNGVGDKAEDVVAAVRASYETKDENGALITDEFIRPIIAQEKNGKDVARISANDSVVFFNFRPDRAREITRALVDPEFTGFDRELLPLYFVCMTQYDKTIPNVDIAFRPESLTNTFGEYISAHGKKQLRIAETEKYAHVTFFFNGGIEKEYEGEDRALIPSPKVATYDLKPSMSAYEVCDEAVKRIDSDKYDAIILNYANCDMVGHTGVFNAAVEAVRAVDECVGRVVDAVLSKGGVAMITADHGNADCMVDPETNGPFTAHTTNPVPFLVVGNGDCKMREGGRLSDIAPTMLQVMGLPKPAEMTGTSLIAE